MDSTVSFEVTGSELVRGLETAELPNARFRHREHVCAAVHFLRSFGYPAAEPRFVKTLSAYAASHGQADKFHVTITLAWMRLVAAALVANRSARSFRSFVAERPDLLDKGLIFRYYSRERIFADDARKSWIEPDLETLPACRPHGPTTRWD